MGAIGSIAGGLIGASSAKKAAAAQERAAQQDLAFQKETRDLIFDRLDPFYQPGITAQNALAFELGLGSRPMIGGTPAAIETFTEQTPGSTLTGGAMPQFGPGKSGEEARQQWQNTQQMLRGASQAPSTATKYRVGDQVFGTLEEAQKWAAANPTGGTEYQGFQATPGYQFQMDQGTAAVNALAGARGGLNSGRTMQDLQTFGQGLANQEYNNYLNRLTGMSGSGQAAAGAQANAATNAASGVSNALSGIGNAQAAGAIGQANAWTGALNNLTALNQYQKGTTGGGGNWLFGGNSWG